MTEQRQDLVVVDHSVGADRHQQSDRHLVLHAELVDETPMRLAVTLPVLDAELVERPPRAVWPDGRLRTDGGMTLRGGVATDPDEIDAIRARIEHYAQPWWRRCSSRRPR